MISKKHYVLSGVPQRTVLASLFFIIMIADIDQNLENSVSKLFADDTMLSTKKVELLVKILQFNWLVAV